MSFCDLEKRSGMTQRIVKPLHRDYAPTIVTYRYFKYGNNKVTVEPPIRDPLR